MAEIILAAHGKMATEVKRSAEMISGEQPRVHTTEFLQGEGIEQVKEKLEAYRKTTEAETMTGSTRSIRKKLASFLGQVITIKKANY